MARSGDIQAILLQAATCPAGARAGLLDRECGSDAALRTEVESLLQSLAGAGRFLAAPTAVPNEAAHDHADAAAARIAAEICDAVGVIVGPYKLLERIGEGGFGTVYMAEQEQPVRRRVALKIIKLGMDTRQVIARFEAERQALAMMDHPNIARVLDAGATDIQSPLGRGRPYFVMELVLGLPVTQYCDDHRLPLRERLALFIDACHAVQHAHQKGVIHRDLKPSNVLVSRYDDKPVVKIIDFGIAKAVAGRLTEQTLITELRQLLGTPAYMSPEQAGLSDLDIDTRSDIYSLGVLLYELLTATTPFDAARLRSADFDELRRIISEDEPPKPSTRMSSLSSAPLASGTQPRTSAIGLRERLAGARGSPSTDIAWARHTDPKSLVRSLRGDLDWVVMKCLEKDRTRRYETANALALDVQRHELGEPVLAAPPGASYRLRKLLRRHHGAALGSSLVAAALIVGVIGTTWQAIRAAGERNRAVAAQQRAVKVKELLERLLTFSQPMRNVFQAGAPQPSLNPDVRLTDVLDEMSPALEETFPGQPEVEADVRLTVGKSYFGLSRFAESRTHLERAFELYQQLFGSDDLRTLDCLNLLGFSCWWSGALDRAEWAFREAVAGFARRGDPRATDGLSAKAGLAMFLRDHTGGQTESIALAREVLAARRETAPENSRDVFMAKAVLATVLDAAGENTDEAHGLALEAFEQCSRSPDRVPADEWFCRIVALDCALSRDALDEAEQHCRAAVEIADRIAGPNSFMGTISRTRLGHCLLRQRRWTEAETAFRQSVVSQRRIFGAAHQLTMETTYGIARACFEQWQVEGTQVEQWDECERLLNQVLAWLFDQPRSRADWGEEALRMAVRLYQDRDVAEPGGGYDQMAAHWSAKLAEWQESTQQAGPSPDLESTSMPDTFDRAAPGPAP